jgi:MoaA/NifB/PqqE/SkfB family radical SAM enzyme
MPRNSRAAAATRPPRSIRDRKVLACIALGAGLKVEVFINLVHVTPGMWETFAKPGVRLATSYYPDHAAEHVAVTKRAGSHRHTRANIVEALRRDIPIRVGVIGLRDAQRHMRGVGRGGAGCASDLCGGCAGEVAAVSPDGSVWPCVFSRWLPVGNVREAPFADILAGQRNLDVRRELAAEFQQRSPDYVCVPMVFEPDSPDPQADTKAIHCVPQFEAETQEAPAPLDINASR